jgi:hypothetical protein
MVLKNGGLVRATDYIVLVVPTAMSKSELADKDTLIVLKDETSGTAEELVIVDFDEVVLHGEVILFTLLVRSQKR